MLKKQIYNKQSGMTAIMLAMFLAIVISLLAVGFATLVRKDQAETLDKTLSYQAQYAAESGVNRITSYIDTTASPLTRSDCNDAVDASIPPKEFTVGQAQVTCAVWAKDIMEPIVLEPDQQNSKFASFKLGPTGNKKISISWKSPSYGDRSANCALPDLSDSNKVVLGVTIAPVSNYGGSKRFYLVPSDNAGCGSQNFSDNSGSVFNAKVTGGTVASSEIDFANFGDYVINVNLINGSGAKKVTIDKANNGTIFTNTSQYKIDVNAKAQDITKRVVVYYNPSGTPGKPYVVNIPSGGTICKDYRVDGTQGTSVSGGDACSNPPTP